MTGYVENQSESLFCPGLQEFWLWLRRWRRRRALSPGGGGLEDKKQATDRMNSGIIKKPSCLLKQTSKDNAM